MSLHSDLCIFKAFSAMLQKKKEVEHAFENVHSGSPVADKLAGMSGG